MRYFSVKGRSAIAVLSGLIFILATELLPAGNMTAPPAAPERMVYDTLHGTIIADPYRWLENDKDTAVKNWVDGQDKYCRSLLAKYPKRKMIQKRIEELMKIGHIGNPDVRKGRYFFTKRQEREDHEVVYMKRGLEGKPEAVLNPNRFSKDGTIALDWWYPSDDGKYIAYGKSANGTENSTLYLLDVDGKRHLSDTISNTSATALAWLKDNSGFYYTRYPEKGTVAKEDEAYYRRVYFHHLGTDYHNDPLIFGEGRDKTDWPVVLLSPDNRYLMIPVYMGWSQTSLYLKDLEKDTAFTLLTGAVESQFGVTMTDDKMYILTNFQAPRFKIMAADYDRPQIQFWRDCIAEQEMTLDGLRVIGRNLVVSGLKDASSRIIIYDRGGRLVKEMSLPAIGSVMGDNGPVLAGEVDGRELLFGFFSYFIPPTIYRYDFDSDSLSIFEAVKTDIDLSQYEVKQVWFPSKDGTKVSMFLAYKKGLKLDGNNPTLLYGYGGFSVNETPSFSRTRMLWLERGGIYADAQIRGGAEYGEEWHRAGMLEKKQNTFDDFIAACEWLIDNKYTSHEKLVIEGGSNGGLLTGAVLVQRPDLIRAVISSRPLLDMLRYHKFLIGQLWIPEYGSADDAEQFKYLYDYSPYHHIKKGINYPAVLFESGDSDTRVDPCHVRKMAAALQAATSSGNPVIQRIERNTGHGQGEPVSKMIAEMLDEWCFVFWQLGL